MGHKEIVAGGPVRVAFRNEGKWAVAYLARVGTMEDAIEIGRMRVSMLREDVESGRGLLKEMWTTILADWLSREIGRHQLPGEVMLENEPDQEDPDEPRIIKPGDSIIH